jgi:hypothetical protein
MRRLCICVTAQTETVPPDALREGFAPGPFSNSFTVDLDSPVFPAGSVALGRTRFKDFGGVVLDTTIDGLQVTFYLPGLDLTLLAGCSGFAFKSGSTVSISHADLSDRTVAEHFTKPDTLFAPPRAIGYIEADLTRLIHGQKLQFAEAVQCDFRKGNIAKAGSPHSVFPPTTGTTPLAQG